MATPKATAPRWVQNGFSSVKLNEAVLSLGLSHQHQGSLRRPFFVQWYEQALIVRNYAGALWRTVVVGCMKPTNWEHCRRVDRWLLPAVQDLIDFYTVEAYSKEQELLRAEDH